MIESSSRPDDFLYESIIVSYLETQSVLKTARALSVSEVKVRRVLLTEGLWSSRTSLQIEHYRRKNMTAAQIADVLHTTEKAVQQYLPYERGIYNKAARTADALHSAQYRERIRSVRKRTLKKLNAIAEREGWREMECTENKENALANKKVYYLHMELVNPEIPDVMKEFKNEAERQAFEEYKRAVDRHREEQQEEELRVLRTYGRLKYDKTITRDIIVPAEMPLYAVHYMIQRAFGWQNSHLHKFCLPQKRFQEITGEKIEQWLELMGVLFPSLLMEDEDRFWADDYERGSIRSWFRRKYTGPYQSLNHREGIVQCTRDREFILQEWSQRLQEPFINVFVFFDTSPNELIERLPISQVLAIKERGNGEDVSVKDSFAAYVEKSMQDEIRRILESGRDEPELQPVIPCCTDELYYEYDFGDGWLVKITAVKDCNDLIRSKRVTEEAVDRAAAAVCTENRPVCIAADGLPVLDDVGGFDGYIQFLRGINREEEWAYWAKRAAREGADKEDLLEYIPDNGEFDGEDTLEWGWSQGWTGRMNRPEKLL